VVVLAFLGVRVGKEDPVGAKNWRAGNRGGEYAKDDERPRMKPKSRKKASPAFTDTVSSWMPGGSLIPASPSLFPTPSAASIAA
jgi:hypothetical protein